MTTNPRNIDEWSPQGPVSELSDEQSWRLLGGVSLGRLGVSVDNLPEIFPVNYHSDGESILFRTADGTKLRDLVANGSVVFEVDSQLGDVAWSVTAKGTARVLESTDEIDTADRAPLPEWHPTAPFVYVRIVPTEVHGRQFRRHLTAERL
jgi:nitroimidazol reductase NimA-like FMN-containing flavoprotein (pyridoxamine 5'-phosphate oxidase superfamily)